MFNLKTFAHVHAEAACAAVIRRRDWRDVIVGRREMLLVMLVLLVLSIARPAGQRTSLDLVRGLVMNVVIRLSVRASVRIPICQAFVLLGILFLVLLLLLARPEMHDLQVWLVA